MSERFDNAHTVHTVGKRFDRSTETLPYAVEHVRRVTELHKHTGSYAVGIKLECREDVRDAERVCKRRFSAT